MRVSLALLCAAGLLLALPAFAQANTVTLDFDSFNGTQIFSGDSVTSGPTAKLLKNEAGVIFTYQGANPNPNTYVSDAPTPGDNKLDTTNGDTLLTLRPNIYPAGATFFSFDVFGTNYNPAGTTGEVDFLDANGAVLSSLNVDETSATGVTYSVTNLTGVQSVRFAADAYYDNIRFTAVPEASTVIGFGMGMLGLTGLALRRRRTA